MKGKQKATNYFVASDCRQSPEHYARAFLLSKDIHINSLLHLNSPKIPTTCEQVNESLLTC